MTITRHRHKVMYHCLRCGILWQGMRHDLSKYSPTEFLPGARFYLGDRSPTEGERREYGYSKAWMHQAVEMPLKYVKEMFCDRVAAGKIYLDDKYTNDNPIEYFLKGNAKTSMHPNTAKLLEGWLMMLQQEGEEKTFAYIKNLK